MHRAEGRTALLVLSVQPCWVAFMVFVFCGYDIAVHPYSTVTVLPFRCCSCPVLQKSGILGAQLQAMGNNCITCSFHAALLGRLHGACFCGYDIAAHPYATTAVLCLDAAVPPVLRKSGILGAQLQAMGTTALLVLFVQSCWVAFMVIVSAG